MSLISGIYGTDDDQEILLMLHTILNVSAALLRTLLGLIVWCDGRTRLDWVLFTKA